MRTGSLERLAIVVALGIFLSASAAAQWLKYPTAGIPRLSDGRPDFGAPPPRTADGKPNLSGLWAIRREQIDAEQGPINISPFQRDIGHGLEGGLPYQPWARALAAQRLADNWKDLPSSRCLPLGPLLAHTYLDPRKIVQTPGLLVILNERDFSYRQIFTDGRPFPEDPVPTWNGYSVGAWEGDTLVVRTQGFRDDLWIDTGSSPMSDVAKMTERIRRPNFGTLDIELTIDDPKNYTKPFTVNLSQHFEMDTELADEFCLENEKSYERMQRSRGK